MTTFSKENVLVLPAFLKNKNFVQGKCPNFAQILENKCLVKGKSPENILAIY
jgi:hypothetical protein